jgi:hypothetical protein
MSNNQNQSSSTNTFTYSNTNQNHPLQQNVQDYFQYKKYVSISSEDRDVIAYPTSAMFEIEMPEDIINVSTVRVSDYAFPSNYSIFSVENGNTTLAFQIIRPYNPYEHEWTPDALQIAIYDALTMIKNKRIKINIQDGFYNPTQMITELTNKMNEAMTRHIIQYFEAIGDIASLDAFIKASGYKRFVVVYNEVSFKIWFGNRTDVFELLNQDISFDSGLVQNSSCIRGYKPPDFSDWGLPSNLGMTRCNITSVQAESVLETRFYYGDTTTFRDSGIWLIPDPSCKGSKTSFIECKLKINFLGPSHFYICIDTLNCIDITSPFSVSNFTLKTNQSNGVVNQALAKIPLYSAPLSEFFDKNLPYYKFFLPPKDNIRRLKISIKYHNGQLVNFDSFNYTFTLEFTQLIPMNTRKINIINMSLI